MSKMNDQDHYALNQNIKFGFLEKIDVPKLIRDCKDKWYNQTLTKVNDCVVRLGVFMEGEFPFHKHVEEDEFFFVLQGSLTIELEHDSVHLEVHQGYTVPKGTIHRPKISEPTVVLMMEGKGVIPTGD